MLLNSNIENKITEQLIGAPKTRRSSKSWSLRAQEISFHPDFGKFFNKLFDRKEQVGFLSISYDLGCYFAQSKLNLVFSDEIKTVRSGDRLEFGQKGLEIFPEKRVNERLDVGMFFFHSKMNKEEYRVFRQAVEQIVHESALLSEIERICQYNETPKNERLEKMKDLLFFEIECAINNSRSKYIDTFKWGFDVKDEWSFFGLDRKEQSKIGIQLNKKSC